MSINSGLFTTKSTEWETPQFLFDMLDEEFGFTLDPCATTESAKCERYYTAGDDGLAQAWEGTVFVNPPYGRDIGKWVKKSYDESRNRSTVVMLIPSRTDTRYWHDYVMKADEIRFIKGRVRFSDSKVGAPFPSAVVVFRGGYGLPQITSFQLK